MESNNHVRNSNPFNWLVFKSGIESKIHLNWYSLIKRMNYISLNIIQVSSVAVAIWWGSVCHWALHCIRYVSDVCQTRLHLHLLHIYSIWKFENIRTVFLYNYYYLICSKRSRQKKIFPRGHRCKTTISVNFRLFGRFRENKISNILLSLEQSFHQPWQFKRWHLKQYH